MTTKSRPFGGGWRRTNSPKFTGELALSELAYNTPCDEETGEVEYGLWHGLIRGPLYPEADCNTAEKSDLKRMSGCIVTEDSQGFVCVEWYGPNEGAQLESDWEGYLAETAEEEWDEEDS